MKKLLTMIFVLAVTLMACGDGGDTMNKQAQADPDTTPLWGEDQKPTIDPKVMYNVMQTYKTCGPLFLKCNPTFMNPTFMNGIKLYQAGLLTKPKTDTEAKDTTVHGPALAQQLMLAPLLNSGD